MDGYSIAATVIALGSAGLAVWTHLSTKRGTTYTNATDITLKIVRLFIEHPEVRPYFYDNAALDDKADRNLVAAVAEFVMDSFECLWDMAKTYEPDDRKAWSEYFSDMFNHSPALRDYYERYAHWYPSMTAWLKEEHRPSAATFG